MLARLFVVAFSAFVVVACSVRAAPPALHALSGAPSVPQLSPEAARRLAAYDWATLREKAAELLADFVRVKSPTGSEKDAADWLEHAARELGLDAERMDGPDTWNVYAGT